MAKLDIKLTKQQQQMLALAVIVLGGGGFAYIKYFWLPTSAKIAATRAKIEEVEKKIEKAKAVAGRLNKIQQELELLNQQAIEAERRLPKDPNLPGVIELVSDLSVKYAMKLNSFTIGKASPKPHFVEVSYRVDMSGTYHNLGRFLAALALQERIFNVRGLTYGKPDASGVMNVNFELISYMYKG